MKTILYNPIFINPQAYYVFPRLTRYLQPDNESTAEPANYIGTIEVKVIAYGDTTLKRTYTNTDSIDLSEFKNTWIRISLFTKVGSCVLGEWKIGNMESDLPYIDPEVLASLKAVVIVGNKTNNDSDRAIVKNLVDPDNPFVISNAAYTEGSGYADKGSPYYGAFVTDGVEDLITSTKTVQEMGITDEVTVVSMIHQIDLNSTYTIATTNYIENSNSREHVRSDVYNYGKTGIYGYSASLINNTKSDIKNILGDEADYYVKSTNSLQTIFDAKFSVVGRISELTEASQVAWYWTIIANKVLTADQINQVIAYFNLDRTLKPDILCDVKKQGITNENHTEFNNKLIDFSGNGRDIQLNNIAWKGDSGIGKYEVDFASLNYNNTTSVLTATYKSCSISKIIKDGAGNIFYNWGQTLAAINSTKIQVIGLDEIGAILEFTYLDESGNSTTKQYSTDGIYDLPASAAYQGDSHNTNFRFSIRGYIGDCDITITQIPSHAGALLLDGINDFGKVTGMPIYKDYTVITDYVRISAKENAQDAPILSKSKVIGSGAFLFNYLNINSLLSSNSFGTNTVLTNVSDYERKIYYQSKYVNDGKSIDSGTGTDYNSMWLGTYRDDAQLFFTGAIYSLMSFPYSMSEFLIERQLKKHKLGTLYPNMVEFRPIIKANDNYKIFYTAMLPLTGDIWERINIGDYVPVGRRIAIQMSFDNEAKKLVSAVSSQLGNITIVKNSNNIGYTIFGDVLKDKSPQKISITIEQDENYVLFNPVITSNVEYHKLDFYLNNYQKRINIGDYIPKGAYLIANFYLKNNVDELTVFTFNGVNISYRRSSVDDTAFNIGYIYNYDSPQEVNITIDEYIRYEDIVQPYPSIINLVSIDKTHFYTYGDKLKVGDVILYNSYKNLLKGFYSLNGQLKYNGVYIYDIDGRITVAKEMVFSWTVSPTWLLDNNEPKCILSPRLLRIPNSSYKILGYIPDISGHSNHGVIHNSAYGEGSGVNEDGSYQFDGVDDFVTIPTTVGGKQVLMKVNWQKSPALLYDQRASGSFAVLTTLEDDAVNPRIAYQARNQDGKTYIDGIENNNIETYTLKDITHNITIANSSLGGIIVPVIGCNTGKSSNFAKMSLYDFMLFDEISTDDKIQELNKYVGIEAKVELPPYYWDTYGKTNSDADRDTIQQRGVAVGDYDLINYNHAYEGMSGYNGYPVVFGESKTWEAQGTKDGDKYYIYTSNANKFNITQIKISSSLFYTYIKRNGELTSGNKDTPSFNLKVTGLDYDKFYLAYYYLKSADVEVRNIINITSDGIYELPKSFASDGSLTETNSYIGLSFTRKSSEIPDTIQNVNVTIEVLPEYENGLVYDGVEDYSKNVNIPALTEYTYIYKRTIINAPTNAATLLKGADKTNGGAFIADYGNKWQFNFGQYNIIQGIADGINWQTVNSFNGTSINKGENTDDSGITVAKFSNGYTSMVFYKLILYPKTISLLEINFLKNLMEKDEIIDLNNPIFIQE